MHIPRIISLALLSMAASGSAAGSRHLLFHELTPDPAELQSQAPLQLPNPTLEICQDKTYLNAINERLQHETTMQAGDLEQIAAFAARCQELMLLDAQSMQGAVSSIPSSP